MSILMKIDEAIKLGKINPEHITPEDLRKLGINPNTASNYLNNHLMDFEKISKGVYRRRRRIHRWILDKHPVTVELYPTIIRIKDKSGNIIRVDKRDGFFIVDLKGEFEFGRKNLRA